MANGNNGSAKSGWRRTVIILSVPLVILILVSAFMALRPKRIRIMITQPVRKDITDTITTNGKVEPLQNFEAHAPVATTVRRILVNEGQRVHRGQLLLELDATDARAAVAKAQAQLKSAEAAEAAVRAGGTQAEVLSRETDLTKAKTDLATAKRNLTALERLEQSGAASRGEVLASRERVKRAQADADLLARNGKDRSSPQERASADAAVAEARAALQAAEDVLRNSMVRAPFDGTVYAIPVRQDAFVNTGDLLLQMANLDEMQVRTFVDEPEIGRLALGQPVQVTWDAVPGRAWTGHVKTLPSTVVNRGSRVVGETMCSVTNSDGRLLPNINVNVTIITSSKANALVIPREALKEIDGRKYVYVVRDNRLVRREVTTGVSDLTSIEIAKGLNANETIAVSSLSPTPLTDGIMVKIIGSQ